MLNAVVTPVFDRALEEARSHPAGPFAGVPYLLKDLACEMEGVRFTEGSRFLAENVSAFDSELVVRLRRAGLVILGKTSTPEFGMAPAWEPVLFGPARNPWDPQRSTSGVQRRLGRRGGVGHGAVRARQRPGRLAAVPGVGVRAVRPQADPGAQPARARVRGRRRRRGGRARAHPFGPVQRRAAQRHVRP